jgi:hypothetical protein
MKTTIYIIISLLITSLSLVWLNQNSHTNKTEISVIRDLTDTFTSKPNSETILHLYNFTTDKWSEGDFRFIEVTDLNINNIYLVSISTKSLFLRNDFKRKDEIKAFNAKVDTIITETENLTSGKNNSAIYTPVANELNRMSKSSATSKNMLIYSDLMENTDKMSFYNKSVLNSIKKEPDKIKQYFESQIKLNKLNGIKIYIIYQPRNTEEDNAFSIVSGFYKQLFESKGADVEITANLN